MRHFLILLSMFLTVVWSAGCAETGSCPEGEVLVDGECATPEVIPLACAQNVTDATSALSWELAVSPTPIESGQPFSANLDGVAVFDELFLDGAQQSVPGGVKEVNLVDLNATVHVRSGADGADVTLTIEPIPYRCFVDKKECDPTNDDLQGVPGIRSNSDCKPEERLNPCGRFLLLPTSTDCASGGVCAGLDKTGPDSQCVNNGFCITGDLRIALKRESGVYTADAEGEVLFGWADECAGATIEEPPVFEEPTGPNGIRVGVPLFPVAIECVMPKITPDEDLISLPIQAP